jgi:hypothetical protein
MDKKKSRVLCFSHLLILYPNKVYTDNDVIQSITHSFDYSLHFTHSKPMRTSPRKCHPTGPKYLFIMSVISLKLIRSIDLKLVHFDEFHIIIITNLLSHIVRVII